MGSQCNPITGECEQVIFCDPTNPAECDDGEVCAYNDRGGTCRAPDAASACIIDAGAATTLSGVPLRVRSVAILDNVHFAVTRAPTFSASAGAIDDAGVLTATCEAGVCDVDVTATYGDQSCTQRVRVFGPNAGDETRVVVVDALRGAPLVDVLVTSDGDSARTDAQGVARFVGARTSVSAFPDTHAWHTMLSPPADVLIATTSTQSISQVAGVKGFMDFTQLNTSGDIKVGVAGVSQRRALPDVTLAPFLGESVSILTDVEGVTAPGGELLPYPLNSVMELGAEPVKGEWVALGRPGPAVMWGFGLQIRLAEIGEVISRQRFFPVVDMMRFGARSDHAVAGRRALSSSTRPDDPLDFSAWDFDEVAIEPSILVALSSIVSFDATTPANAIIIAVSADIAGHGIVPLGGTATRRDEDDSGEFEIVEGQPPNTLVMDYAPAHHGLDRGPFVVNIAAFDEDELALLDPRRITMRTHVFVDTIPAEIVGGEFLAVPTGTFDSGANATVDDVIGATTYRVRFDDGSGAEWNVWSPSAFTFDVLAHNPDGAARAINARVEAFALDVTYETLVSSRLDRLTLEPGAWSAFVLQ